MRKVRHGQGERPEVRSDHKATERSPHQVSGTDQHKRLVVGWSSFTCCEDSTILFTELLNDHLEEWKKVMEFRHMKVLRTSNSLAGLDVAFIEGAISSESQAKEVQRIRENTKYVVVIGACACTGQPSTGLSIRAKSFQSRDPPFRAINFPRLPQAMTPGRTPTSPVSGPSALGPLLSSSVRLAPSSAGLSAAAVPFARRRLSSSGGRLPPSGDRLPSFTEPRPSS